jgi:hypothetical protein
VLMSVGLLLGFLVLVLIRRVADVQEAAMPDQLDLGTLYQNSRVEFDVRLLTSARLSPLEQLFDKIIAIAPKSWENNLQEFHPRSFRRPLQVVNLTELKPHVSVPSFLKIAALRPEQNTNWYEGNPFVSADLLADTSRTGIFAGEITAVMNRRRATLPIRFSVKSNPDIPRALIISPFQGTSTAEGAQFEPLVKLLSIVPERIDYLAELPENLRPYKLVLLADAPLAHLSTQQVTNLQQALSNGSRIVIACNYFFRGTVSSANLLTANYGLNILDTERPGEEICTNIISDPLTTNITILRLHRASPIELSGGAQPLVVAPNSTNSYAAVARLPGGGELAVLTQSLWWYWPHQFPTNNQNAIFLRNLLQLPKD